MKPESTLEKFKEKEASNPYAIMGGKEGPIDRSDVNKDARD